MPSNLTASRSTDRVAQLRAHPMERVQSGDSVYEVTSNGERRPVPARVQSGDSVYDEGTGRPAPIRLISGDSNAEHELHELEPSPVDELSDEWLSQKQWSNSSSSRKSTAILGLSEQRAISWLSHVQRYSSYAISAFLTMHITNVSLVPLATRSVPASDSYLLLTRPYYQSPILESAVVLLPITLHTLSGLGLRSLRQRQSNRWYAGEDATASERRSAPRLRISGTSALGLVLAPLALMHKYVNRGIPKRLDGGSSSIGLGYVSHAFAKHPWAASLAYVSLFVVAAWHTTWGSAKYLGLTPAHAQGSTSDERRKNRKARWWAINGLAAIVAGVWAAGSLGVVARGGQMGGWRGTQWDSFYRQIPVLGKYW